MSTNFWKVPAWERPIDKAVKVDVFRLPERDMISEHGWPETFWHHTRDRKSFGGEKAQHIIKLFRGLSPGSSARCHMSPWGVAFYDHERLLFTATLCFECSNVYVYTALGKDLRAFDVDELHAKNLLRVLNQELPIEIGGDRYNSK